MSMYQRHFRVDSGALLDEVNRIIDLTEQVRLAWKPLLDQIGAKQYHYWRDGSFAGFGFEEEPDQALFRRHRKFSAIWLPRKNVAEGKAMWQQINAMPQTESIQNALQVAGITHGMPALIEGNRWYGPTMGGFPKQGIWFVEVPWRDEDPEKLKAYKAERDAGKRGDCELDHLLWTPPEEWREIKHWEYLKEWEELGGTPPKR